MKKNEIIIHYEEENQDISFLPAKGLTASTQVMILVNVLGVLIHQQCIIHQNTKEQRTEILKAIFKDLQDQLTSMDEEE